MRTTVRGLALVLIACTLLDCRQRDEVQPPDTISIFSPDSTPAAPAESTAQARDEWNKAEIIKRLTEAGLVVVDANRVVEQPYLTVRGEVLRVGGSELQIYVYRSALERGVDSGQLDPIIAAPRNTMVSWRQPPHLIVVNNLIAIHLTPREHLAERVRDVLTARHLGLD
jgi:hypothetical protein